MYCIGILMELNMTEQTQDEETTVADIRITDNVIKRMVIEEQRRIGDPNPTKTAGRIIERYFAMRPQPAAQPATS